MLTHQGSTHKNTNENYLVCNSVDHVSYEIPK
jgi:hypothetical protein